MPLTKSERRQKIKMRIRGKLSGTSEKPRMSVFRSNKQMYVQIVDDSQGKTLLAVSSLEKVIADKKDVTKIEQAKLVGKLIAEKCKKNGIKQVVFDRSVYLFHGRVKSLADAARENGLKI